eukprot:1195929-Prorocentrum_minimum.AAC.8
MTQQPGSFSSFKNAFLCRVLDTRRIFARVIYCEEYVNFVSFSGEVRGAPRRGHGHVFVRGWGGLRLSNFSSLCRSLLRPNVRSREILESPAGLL